MKIAGEKIFDKISTITSPKVTFKISDWQNDLERRFLSMAAKRSQVFQQKRPFFSNSAHETSTLRRQNSRK